jgi:hypothetical protein
MQTHALTRTHYFYSLNDIISHPIVASKSSPPPPVCICNGQLSSQLFCIHCNCFCPAFLSPALATPGDSTLRLHLPRTPQGIPLSSPGLDTTSHPQDYRPEAWSTRGPDHLQGLHTMGTPVVFPTSFHKVRLATLIFHTIVGGIWSNSDLDSQLEKWPWITIATVTSDHTVATVALDTMLPLAPLLHFLFPWLWDHVSLIMVWQVVL